VECYQASGDFHHCQHYRHIGLIGDMCRKEHSETGHEGSRGIGAVITSDGRLVDMPEACSGAKDCVRKNTDYEVREKADAHETGSGKQGGRILVGEFGEFFAAVPADSNEQVNCKALVDDIREIKLHTEDGNQETHIEE